MKRLVTLLLLVVGLPAVLVFSLGAGQSKTTGYEVRAIFDNAAYIVKGEDVKIAGAVVGRVKSLDVTSDKRAALVLQIDKPGFANWHRGAHCTVRPQSLIGEKFVECTPGPDAAPELAKIEKGDGKGQRLLENTTSPVDLDLINDTLRLPYRQRFALIINEFGTALAGRGRDLNEAIRRSNPALRQTDEVLNVLADQNQTLARLQRESDTVLAPLAERRKRVSGFINSANQTAQATAERRTDIQRSIERLPTWLRELRPTLADLSTVSDEFTPVLADLRTAAPDLSRFIGELGPFSQASIPALTSLGDAADIGGPALERSRPLIRKLGNFATDAGPVSQNLDRLTQSIDKTGGIERAMDYVFFQMLAINGFDGISHYLRAALITNLCSSYATGPVNGCNANFRATKAVGGGSSRVDPSLKALRDALGRGVRLLDRNGTPAGQQTTGQQLATPQEAAAQLRDPRVKRTREAAINKIRSGAASGQSPYFNQGSQSPDEQALDYLLGNDK
jgi:phospholipid/cholesterol/gamma-HCH transport system substrate-binding protein